MSFPAYPDYKDSGVPWLGNVPSHWDRMPLFALVRELDDGNVGMKEDNLLSLSYGQIKRKNIDDNDGLLPASFETYQIVERDDVVWRLTDLQNDQRSLRTGIVRERGIITSAYLATRPTGITPEFLAYLLRAYDLTKVFYSMGGGLRQSMKFSDVKWLPIMLPNPEEQAAIVTFLDRETAKIDVLVGEQERLIALLKEKRQAVICHAVTKGLNPDAPMKDSGIVWLGEIPAHWSVCPLSYRYNVALGKMLDEKKISGNFLRPYLRNTDVQWEKINCDDLPMMDFEPHELDRYSVVQGDLVVCEGGDVGRAAIWRLDEPVCYQKALHRIRPRNAMADTTEFLLFSFEVYANLGVFTAGEGKSTIAHLPAERLRRYKFPFPPLVEQFEIAEHLTLIAREWDILEAEAQAAITLLQERRAALISAAVTGKIDVRGVASQSNVVSIESAGPARSLPSLRAVIGSLVISKIGDKGRMAVMKGGYLAEAHCGLNDIGGRYERNAAGPYDGGLVAAMERGAYDLCGIKTIEPPEGGDRVTYQVPQPTPLPKAELEALVGEDQANAFNKMLSDLSGIGREGIEAVATIYAVWNDLIAAGNTADDDAICNGVLNDWHEEKRQKFKRTDLDRWLAWMRRNGFVPDGKAPRTDHQGNLFA